MPPRTPPDWTKTGTVAGYADYLRKQSDAICVLVICPHRSVFSVDPACAPEDAQRLVEEYVPRLSGWTWRAKRRRPQRGSSWRITMNKPGDGDARHICICGHQRHEGLCGKPRYVISGDPCRCSHFIDARIGLEKPAPCESLDSRNTRLLAEASKAR